ncbi:SDR family oxidoreductase [Sphaerisporangium sp. B11E5]|uniref:SDR family oxidoreductase n=1 Tax=Sphaerisporangium sp. B11E5 TaxID=3153563 RepID=UPI00325F6F87
MGKTWFITGATSGFGRAMAELLLERGDRVAAAVRRPDRLSDLVSVYGDRLWAAEVDVTDTARLREVVGRAFAGLGRIDVVVSNAGYGAFGAAEEFSDEAIDRQIATNLSAPIQLLRAVLPPLRAQGGGRIIQLSSAAGQAAFPGGSLYHATKWGVEGFFDAVAQEVGAFGIEVTLVEPGVARTAFGTSMDIAPGLDVYAATPVGEARRHMESPGGVTAGGPGDPDRIAAAIVASADVTPAPRRLTLGSDAYRYVHSALTGRLRELEAARDTAFSTDFAAA